MQISLDVIGAKLCFAIRSQDYVTRKAKLISHIRLWRKVKTWITLIM